MLSLLLLMWQTYGNNAEDNLLCLQRICLLYIAITMTWEQGHTSLDRTDLL